MCKAFQQGKGKKKPSWFRISDDNLGGKKRGCSHMPIHFAIRESVNWWQPWPKCWISCSFISCDHLGRQHHPDAASVTMANGQHPEENPVRVDSSSMQLKWQLTCAIHADVYEYTSLILIFQNGISNGVISEKCLNEIGSCFNILFPSVHVAHKCNVYKLKTLKDSLRSETFQ